MRMSDWSSDVCSSDLLATKIRTAITSQSVDPAPPLPQRIALGVSQGIGDPIRAFDMLLQVFASQRSEARRLGQEGVSTCSSRWSPSNSKNQQQNIGKSLSNNVQTTLNPQI